MTKEEKVKALEFRASFAQKVIISALLSLMVINSPYLWLINHILIIVLFAAAFYLLYDFHLRRNTDTYDK